MPEEDSEEKPQEERTRGERRGGGLESNKPKPDRWEKKACPQTNTAGPIQQGLTGSSERLVKRFLLKSALNCLTSGGKLEKP